LKRVSGGRGAGTVDLFCDGRKRIFVVKPRKKGRGSAKNKDAV